MFVVLLVVVSYYLTLLFDLKNVHLSFTILEGRHNVISHFQDFLYSSSVYIVQFSHIYQILFEKRRDFICRGYHIKTDQYIPCMQVVLNLVFDYARKIQSNILRRQLCVYYLFKFDIIMKSSHGSSIPQSCLSCNSIYVY